MTGQRLSPEEARRLLHDAVDAVQPAPGTARRIHDGYQRRRRARKIQAAVAGIVVGCAAAAVAIAAPLAGHPRSLAHHKRASALAEKPPSQAALAGATRAGQRAETADAGAPVGALGIIGPEAAWVLDGNGLFTTADAGARWDRVTPPAGDPLANILSVTFSGPEDGWAIVAHPESATATVSIDRTNDGGRTWQAALEPAAGASVTAASISFAGPSAGFAAINRYQQPRALLFATNDGGARWHMVTATAPAIGSGLRFTSATDGWGISSSGRLYRTTDGGLTWSEPQLPGFEPHGTHADPHAAGSASLPDFFGDHGVLLVRGPGTSIPWGPTLVESTGDGGRSWQSHPLPFDPDAPHYGSAAQMPFAAASPDVWLYFGSSELGGNTYANVTFLRATADSGRSWATTLPNLGVTGVQSLTFATGSAGWAVVDTCTGTACQSAGGLLLYTADGGRHFTPLRPPS
jgi:photosystem II stability/assembly factor-like uncharacterized protein